MRWLRRNLEHFEVDEANKRVKVLVSPRSIVAGHRQARTKCAPDLEVDRLACGYRAERWTAMGFEQKVAQAVDAIAAIPGIDPGAG